MKVARRYAFMREMDAAKLKIEEGFLDEAFTHLERAHIVGQEFVVPHTLTHLYMLKIGWLKKDYKEMLAQFTRIPFGIIGSIIGVLPEGNTGGANVHPMKKLPIPEDLKKVIEEKKK